MHPIRLLPASAACRAPRGPPDADGPDRITKNSYDLAGQLTKVTEALGTTDAADEATYAYTATGKREFLTDARGYKAKFEYDGHDRQVKWLFPDKVTPGVDPALMRFPALPLAGNVRPVLFGGNDRFF